MSIRITESCRNCQTYTGNDNHPCRTCAIPGFCPAIIQKQEHPSQNDKLYEFLKIGPSKYCVTTGLQCCHICDRIECGDNTHPAVLELRKIRDNLNKHFC